MKFLFVILFGSCSFSAFAQSDTTWAAKPTNKDSLRATYIKSFPDHFFLWPVLKQRRLDFEMKSLLDNGGVLTYKSNKPYSLGVGMYIFEVGLELTFSAPLAEKNKEIYGESEARDLQFNIIGKRFGFDAFYQRYNGFYIEDSTTPIPADTPFPQRPDIETRNFGLTGNYVFNNNRFSFLSAYNFAERQLRSSGSFLLFATVNAFKAAGDSAILGQAYATRFGNVAQIQELRSTAFSIAPGYTYSLIFKDFFLNGTLAIGPAHNWLGFVNEDGTEHNDIQFNVFSTARLSMGYNGDRFFGALTFVSQGKTSKFENLELTTSAGTFKILFGYRFREVGILKRRAKDIPKEIF